MLFVFAAFAFTAAVDALIELIQFCFDVPRRARERRKAELQERFPLLYH